MLFWIYPEYCLLLLHKFLVIKISQIFGTWVTLVRQHFWQCILLLVYHKVVFKQLQSHHLRKKGWATKAISISVIENFRKSIKVDISLTGALSTSLFQVTVFYLLSLMIFSSNILTSERFAFLCSWLLLSPLSSNYSSLSFYLIQKYSNLSGQPLFTWEVGIGVV